MRIKGFTIELKFNKDRKEFLVGKSLVFWFHIQKIEDKKIHFAFSIGKKFLSLTTAYVSHKRLGRLSLMHLFGVDYGDYGGDGEYSSVEGV